MASWTLVNIGSGKGLMPGGTKPSPEPMMIHSLSVAACAIHLKAIALEMLIEVVINPLHAKFFRGNKNIYLHFMSLLHIDMTQVVEILPKVRQDLTYPTQSISWVLMSWRHKELGHQQPWWLQCWIKLIRSPHVKGKNTSENDTFKTKTTSHKRQWVKQWLGVQFHENNISIAWY